MTPGHAGPPCGREPFVTVLYASRPSHAVTGDGLRRLIGDAQVRNRRRDITGWLCFTGRHYVQVLEGRRDEVDALLQRISADPGHHGMRCLFQQPSRQRRYGTWSMALIHHLDLADEVEAAMTSAGLREVEGLDLADRLYRAAGEVDAAMGDRVR